MNNLGGYHDLHVQSDTLLLCNIFKNVRETCLKTYDLDPTNFYSAPELAWFAVVKRKIIN